MDKRQLHRFWTKIRPIKPWYALAVFAVLLTVSVLALRENNVHMVALRSEVYQADKQGKDVTVKLQALQAYVTTHMNTDLSSGPNAVYPPVQLKYTYDRLVQKASKAAADENSRIYIEAQKYCERQNSSDFSGRNRVPCIQNYIKAHSTEIAAAVPDSLYKFDFVSPVWSADFAGWTVLATIASFVVLVLSLVGHTWLKRAVS